MVYEKKTNTRLITKASVVNIIYVLAIFFILLFVFGNVRIALVYTIMAQIISLVANGAFWIKWSFNNLKVKTNVKLGVTTLIAVALISGISFLMGILAAITF